MPAAAIGFIGGMFSFGAGAAFAAGGAAFSGWVAGASFAGTLLGGLSVKLLSSVALSALAGAMQSEPPQGGGLTISTTVRGEQNPETIILGTYATSGQAICAPYSHGESNKYLTHVIELCSAPGAQISRILLGEEWVQLTDPFFDASYGRTVSGDKYGGNVWVQYYDGTQTAADPYLLAKYGDHPDRPWEADMVGSGLCYAVLTFKYEEEDLPQVPRYRFEMTGLPLYDLRRDSSTGGNGTQRLDNPSTWGPSQNPIVMVWNIMRGIPLPGGDVYGGNIRDLRNLPRAAWIAAMNRCDQPVTLSDDRTEPMYRAGLEISLDQPPAAAIEELLKACAGTIADLGYGWGILAGAPSLPVYAFTDEDVIVSRQQELDPFPGLQDTYNAVSAKFPDRTQLWETKEAPQRTNVDLETSDAFGRRMASLSLPAVPFSLQVQRLMRAWIEDERRFRRHVISLPPDAAHAELTETVDWSSQRNGYDAKAFSIHEIVEDPRTAIRQFSLRERDPNDYSWTPTFELPTPPSPPAVPVVVPEVVSGFDAQGISIVDGGGAPRRPAIRLSWNPEIVARALRWEIRLLGSTAVAMRGTTADLAAGEIVIADGILRATDYEAHARPVRAVPTAWTTWRAARTPDVGFTWDDWDEDLREDIQGNLALIPAAAEAAADARARADQVRSELDAAVVVINEDIEAARGTIAAEAQALRGEAATARGEVNADIAAAEALAAANLNIARQYTDTSVQSESVSRVSGDEALAAQIRTLTAVLNSENFLENSRFSTGLTGWVGFTASATSVAVQDDASSDPVVADAPTAHFLRMVSSPTGWRNIRQDFPVEFTTGEVFQWRVQVAVSDADRSVQVLVYWYDAAGAQIGGPIATTIVPTIGVWRIFSGQHTPPPAAVSVRFLMRVGASSSALPVSFADASFTKVDQSVIARVTDLEVVVANNQQSAASFQTDALARFGQNESAISNEASARSNADSALAGQISIVSASASRARTFYQAEAPGNPQVGDIWIDGDRRYFRWGGDPLFWMPIDDPRIGQTAAAVVAEATARADADAALASQITTVSAQATRTRTFRQPGAPAVPQAGDLWYRTDQGNRAYRYSGTAWQETDDTRLAENAAAITAEATARTTADNAMATQISTVSATANAKARTFRQAAAPTGASAGDLWFDTANGNLPRRWSGTAWVATEDTRVAGIAASVTEEATARANADNALSQRITTVTSEVEDVRAVARAEALARSTADTALVATTESLSARASSIAGRIFPADMRNLAEFWTQSLSGSPETVAGVSAPPILFATDPAVGSYIRIPAGHPSNLHVVSKAVTEYEAGRMIRLSVRCRAVGGTITKLRALFAAMDANWANTRNLNTGAVISPTIGSTWQVVTLDYRIPAAQAGDTWLRIGVFSNAGDGPNRHVDIASIRIDDITAVDQLGGDLSGDITELKALDLSALAGTALGTLLQQLRVSAGGTSATITQQGTAVADLQGNASAGYLIQVGAGGEASLLEMIAADGSGRRPTSIARLAADQILLEGSVYADQLAVVGVPTLVHDPLYKRLNSWIGLSAPLGRADASATGLGVAGWGSEKILVVNSANTGYSRALSRKVQVSPGARIKAEAMVRSGTVGRTAGLRIFFYATEDQAAGSPTAVALSNTFSTTAGIARIEVNVPSNCAWMALELANAPTASSPDSGNAFFGFPSLRNMDAANLIVDGGIVAGMVTAETMRAINGRFSDLMSANIRVGNAEIGTLQIGPNAVVVPVGGKGAIVASAGEGNWRNLLSLNVPLFRAGPIAVSWAIRHYYYEGGFGAYGLRIRLNGNIIEQKDTNGLPSDFPSGNAFGQGLVGNNSVVLQWQGWGGLRLEAQGSMTVLGIQ